MKLWCDLKYWTESGKENLNDRKIRWINTDPFYVGSFLDIIFATSYWCAIKILGVCSLYQTLESKQTNICNLSISVGNLIYNDDCTPSRNSAFISSDHKITNTTSMLRTVQRIIISYSCSR